MIVQLRIERVRRGLRQNDLTIQTGIPLFYIEVVSKFKEKNIKNK